MQKILHQNCKLNKNNTEKKYLLYKLHYKKSNYNLAITLRNLTLIGKEKNLI